MLGAPPLKASVIVTVWWTLVGLPAEPSLNAKIFVPSSDPLGVEAAPLSQVAVAVLVPLAALGAELYVHV